MRDKRKKYEEIAVKLSVFSFGKLQSLVTLDKLLKKEGITLADVKGFVEYTKKSYEQAEKARIKAVEMMTKRWNKNAPKCPVCNSPLGLKKIKEKKGKGNVKGYTCLWFCKEEECLYEKYSYEDFQKAYKKIMGGG